MILAIKNNNYYKNSKSEVLEFLLKKYTEVLKIDCDEKNFIKNLTSRFEYWVLN
tara:strand:+ start:328 stop:489 length:162 start_codon:yes stop_codon:yes gene_type:complete